MRALLAEALDHVESAFDEASARDWADSYQFPREYISRDISCQRTAQRDFVAMIRRRLTILAPQRLNPARIASLRADKPEIEMLLDLAGGMRVPLPAGFVPNGSSPSSPLRPIYVRG